MRMRSMALPLVLLALVAGCAARKPEVVPANYTVSVGEEFDVRLPANPSTGYRWQVGSLQTDKMVRLVDTRYVPTAPDPMGAGGTDVFTFVGVGQGRATIELVYVRPWEKGIAPARTASYSVDVL